MLHAALTRQPLPRDLLAQAIRRNHAEQRVTRPRAALIKMVLTGLREIKEGTMQALDVDHPDAAYHCGRLLAVLEEIQRAAIKGINATVADRFYGSASSMPHAVFPRLVRGAVPHLSKLQRDRRPAYIALQRRMEGVMEAIPARPAFPHTLTPERQGLFALGYYHQKAHDRAEATAARARNQAHALTVEDIDGDTEKE
jgi:CRISPR-associated protein Csd1